MSGLKKSYKLPSIQTNPWLVVDFQALGRLDEMLKQSWSRSIVGDLDARSDQEIQSQSDIFMLSRLWVLSGYEIVRILKATNPDKYQKVYSLFRKVRIPLAKYEKPGKSKKFSIARIGYREDKAIGWSVSETEFITRDELADILLKAI